MRMQKLLLLTATIGAATLTLAATKPPAATGTRAPGAPTWSRDVASIVYKNCTPCHRKGEAGPFPLESYADAKRMARMMAVVTKERLMPPWKPVDGHGDFRDERSLTDAEIRILNRWAAADAPSGDLKTAPPLPRFKTGWQLGTPDMVLEMPAAFPIPAEGRDVYQSFVFPLGFPKDRYLRGIEVRPGNRRVAHHAVGVLDTSGTARKLDAKSPEQGYASMGGSGFLPAGLTPGYVPGQTPRFFDDGSPLTLSKKADFVLQMHYHPSGKPETDRTVVGLYFTDKKPVKNPTGILLASEEIDIPAGASGYTVSDKFVLPTALAVHSVWAHMHMVGKKVRVWAELPGGGGTEKMLLINDWDFNWQDTYGYRKPIRLPKGTILHSEWVFDNTAANPRNPNSPPKRVRLGENSTDEMTGLWVGGLADDGWGELSLLGANIGHYFEITGKGKPFREAR
ncbi:MAG: hypothetical protein H7145_13755 [Akkermansiaceae bacterium]|nr:hypothetical protein [Armatimonadota bacterium]